MSEYIEIKAEPDDDPALMHFSTNLALTEEGEEFYRTPEEMEEGSPVAQALAYTDGIRTLRIAGKEMVVARDPEMPWHIIVADISAILRDFFL